MFFSRPTFLSGVFNLFLQVCDYTGRRLMFSNLWKTRWLPQIDINAVEAQADYIGIRRSFFLLLAVDSSRRLWGQTHFSAAGNQVKWQI